MMGRERMLTALDGGVPDHLPASVHDWMPFWLENYLSGASAVEAFERFGLDWSIYRWKWNLGEIDPDKWEETQRRISPPNREREDEILIRTPKKTLRQVWKWDQYGTHWTTDYLFKEPEDVFIWCRWHPVEKYDLDYERESLEIVGDNGILRAGRIGPWHRLCDNYGIEKMILSCFEDPDWVRDAMNAVTELDLRAFESMQGSRIDLFETGGGHNSSTVISPDIFREFILPYEQRIHSFLKDEIGIRTVYHTCGGMMPILDMLVEVGSNALETLTPPSMGGDVDLAEVKRRVGGKVALIGGFDQYNGFENATTEQTREHVRHCFETAGKGGAYIMNPSDHFFDAPIENLEAYADEARKCVY